VPSQHNPADAPSRGILGPPNRLLPPVSLPSALRPFVRDAAEASAWPRNLSLPPKHHKRRGDSDGQPFASRHLERLSEELLAASAAWHDA
jgi:hypothetical protein